jgi:hypothetical protein
MIHPTDADILLGRGVKINNHPGNEAYREIISENAVRIDRRWNYCNFILRLCVLLKCT